ncbi:MAG: hypothetical protein FWF88_10890 [Peptococcaceae bacterium]|nr:hypothetical protein [Peptococcaceae bacterium]
MKKVAACMVLTVVLCLGLALPVFAGSPAQSFNWTNIYDGSGAVANYKATSGGSKLDTANADVYVNKLANYSSTNKATPYIIFDMRCLSSSTISPNQYIAQDTTMNRTVSSQTLKKLNYKSGTASWYYGHKIALRVWNYGNGSINMSGVFYP